MVRGYLRIIVLKELYSTDHTGYELMKKVELYTGERPSPGSMYPLLKSLQDDGLIKGKKAGRKIGYHITEVGRAAMDKLVSDKENVVCRHMEIFSLLSKVTGKKFEIGSKMKHLDLAENPLIRNIDIFTEIRNSYIRIASSKDYRKKDEEIREILKETLRRFRKVERG